MFFKHSTKYYDIANDPLRQCFLGKATKLYKCCNIAANKFMGYINDSGNSYWEKAERYMELRKRERVSWEIQEVPCMIMATETIQYGVCFKKFETLNKTLCISSMRLNDIIRNVEQYVCHKSISSIGNLYFYNWNHDIIIDEHKIICPATMPYYTRNGLTKRNNYVCNTYQTKYDDLSNYCYLISSINEMLGNDLKLWE